MKLRSSAWGGIVIKHVVFNPTFTFLNRKAKRGARKIGCMELGMHDW